MLNPYDRGHIYEVRLPEPHHNEVQQVIADRGATDAAVRVAEHLRDYSEIEDWAMLEVSVSREEDPADCWRGFAEDALSRFG